MKRLIVIKGAPATPAGPQGGNPLGPSPVVVAVESAIQSAAVAQIMAALIASQPWVAMPFINGIITWIVNWGVGLAMKESILGLNDLWIQYDTGVEVQAVQDSVYTYQGLVANNATPAQIAAAQANLETAAAALITIQNNPI